MEAAGGITVVHQEKHHEKNIQQKANRAAVACALTLGICPAPRARKIRTVKPICTMPSTHVVKSGTGLCWQTSFGPPPAPAHECDPNYVVD